MSKRGLGPRSALSLEVFPSLSGRAAITRVREIGYTAAGLPAWRKDFSPSALGVGGARDLSVFLGRNGLAASWLSAGCRGRFASGAALAEDVDRVSSMLYLAGLIKAPAVVAALAPLGRLDSEAARNAREAVAALAIQADSTGAALALLPAQGEWALADAFLEEFVDAPVGLLLDPGALAFAGSNPADLGPVRSTVTAVRASDSSGEETNLAPGEGRVGWRDFLAALAARDYHGSLTVEFAPRGADGVRAAKALELLRRLDLS